MDRAIGDAAAARTAREAVLIDATTGLPYSGAGTTVVVGATFSRPANATPYASGLLVANSTAAGSVVAMAIAVGRVAGGTGMIRRVRIKKSGTGITNASFRLHLYKTDPALSTGITNGDGGVWLTKEATYLGAFDVTIDKVFSDASKGIGLPLIGTEINFDCSAGSQVIYGLLEARGAYTPGSGETFTVALEVLQN